jgi:hypothetical protein
LIDSYSRSKFLKDRQSLVEKIVSSARDEGTSFAFEVSPLDRPSWRPGLNERSQFFVREDAASREKPDALGRLYGKSRSASGYNIDNKLCV